MRRKPLGQILIEGGHTSEDSLNKALARQQDNGGRLGNVLLQAQALTEESLLKALGQQLNIPYTSHLLPQRLDGELLSKLPIDFLRHHKVFPAEEKHGELLVATTDPLDTQVLDSLRALLGKPTRPILCPEHEIMRAINRLYERDETTAEKMMEVLNHDQWESLAQDMEAPSGELDLAHEAPIIKFINLIIFQAIRERASDIHIEPYERDLRVRFRIDGVLYDVLKPPKVYQAAIVSRVKVMAHLNIAEKRLPQDGRIQTTIGDRGVDIRVSIIPVVHGEKVVLRLLERTSVLLQMEDIGFGPDCYEQYLKLIRRSNGIILVTGPTGSGKTTTLYATITKLNSDEQNIITIEDPVEYQLRGINQIQVSPKVGLTFANGLRSILRQDPDIVLVGEVRDVETAEIAIHASLTGHLVFSTLHTNDSAGAVTRLVDMGIEPFLVASSLVGVMAQRLVRLICEYCKEPVEPDEASLREIGLSQDALTTLGGHLYVGKGCSRCYNTGYRGRTGIYELLLITDSLRRCILSQKDSASIKAAAVEGGLLTLLDDGARKVLAGVTTIQEVLRVTQV